MQPLQFPQTSQRPPKPFRPRLHPQVQYRLERRRRKPIAVLGFHHPFNHPAFLQQPLVGHIPLPFALDQRRVLLERAHPVEHNPGATASPSPGQHPREHRQTRVAQPTPGIAHLHKTERRDPAGQNLALEILAGGEMLHHPAPEHGVGVSGLKGQLVCLQQPAFVINQEWKPEHTDLVGGQVIQPRRMRERLPQLALRQVIPSEPVQGVG